MNKLIVTCDDCGVSEGINLATVRLHESGMATSATVVTNFGAAKHGLDLFARYSSLGVGVHLNLTDGISLTQTQSSSLSYVGGHFRPRRILFAHALFPTNTFLELAEKELAAQIEFFFENGMHPRHLTTHIQFHMFPSLREILFKLAQRYHIPWIRSYSLRSVVLPFNPLLSGRTTSPLTFRANSILVPNYIAAVKYWMRCSPDQMATKLIRLRGTLELVVHPCLPSDSTFPSRISYLPIERFEETQYFEKVFEIIRRQMKETEIHLEPEP